MSDLYWPGDERAGEMMSDAALLRAMVRVEGAWLKALVDAGVAEVSGDLDNPGDPVDEADLDSIARSTEAGGNPVQPMLSLLRERLQDRDQRAAAWLHRGLTSQDVLDTALMLCTRDACSAVRRELDQQIDTLTTLTRHHRGDVMPGRTLGQHAVPITFGLKAARWLQGVLDAYDGLAVATRLPVQLGGAAGTLAAPAVLAAESGAADPPRTAQALVGACADTLGLRSVAPWHTNRAPVTRLGDALVGCTDAWGPIAYDVATLSRPEIAELAELAGGGSSTMPHKQNPVLSALIRRAALAAPSTASQLHLAAADSHDERPDGEWHVEWSALRTLARHTVTAANQTSELLTGLRVDAARMRENAEAASAALLAERDTMSAATGGVESYLGASELVIDAALDRARTRQEANR